MALTQQQIEHLAGLMEERRRREMSEISSVAERSRDERSQQALTGGETQDEILKEMMQHADYAVVRQNLQDVRDIDAARKRIEAGTYGICVDCGGEIGYPRLLAYPTAKRCIRCQEAHERKRAHPR